MSWHLAPALAQLRAEVNKKWPNRSKASDGTIGDPAHSARVSDHNPNGRRSVNAMDITATGIDTGTLIAIAKKHPSVRYIIHNRRIMNRDIGNWAVRVYKGSNPHTQHVHISLYQSATAENRRQSWGLANARPVSGVGSGGGGNTYKAVKYGDLLKLHTKGAPVKEWQSEALGYSKDDADSFFGPDTVEDTKKWQKANGLTADGKVGDKTWAKYKSGKFKKPKATAPKFPLPSGHWYGPESSDKRNHSGYWAKDREAIKDIQRAVGAKVDGYYGDQTYRKVKAKQKALGIKVDGGVGKQTWGAIF